MGKTTNGPFRKFQNFNEAANQILKMLSDQMDINTLFIAQNDGETNTIKKAFNRNEELVTEDSLTPLNQTFCSLTIQYGQKPLKIEKISTDEDAAKLEIASQFENGSFMGIPIYYEDGKVYGTICGLDNHPFTFTEEHQEMFEMMSSLLTYILELEKARKEIQMLSSPVVPLSEQISILNVIGNITLVRAQQLVEDVVQKVGQEIEFLIIDFSGVTQVDSQIETNLLDLIKTLKIMGITPIITGISPLVALKVPHFAHSLKGERMEATLKIAIEQLGVGMPEKNEIRS
ncbi:STAS domain-containing protein [Planococcus sp. CPCC 101016]|uniref:STAS domain-containing protein n=1 Tax=Planococcus sp. CPCC 101016 TaxID=2599617 RepID=UPI0011B582BD|nr:STAS domain-containing protein [Planococcus sp. CPCC 101016]TWT08046.1 STAS domain-containing protein [Planococcus sp. CPCC 101016]